MSDYSILEPRVGYGHEILPCSLDMQIQEIMAGIANGEEFARVRSALPRNAGEVLDTFAERMASLAVRNGSLRDLRDGLLAVQLALMLTDDHREVLPAVSLLQRASDLIGADTSREFRETAERAGDPPDNHLTRFLERSSEKKRIERMGFTEGTDDSGFRFLRSAFHRPASS